MTPKDLYKHILGPSRRCMISYLACSMIQGICLPLTMFLTQRMIDGIAGKPSMAYRSILFLFVTFIVDISTKRYLEYIGACMKNSIRLHGGELIFRKMSVIRYAYLEEKDAYQLSGKMGDRYESIYMEYVCSWGIAVRLLISFLGIFYYLTIISPWILVTMLVSVVPIQALSVYSVTREFNSWEKFFPFMMKAQYLSRLLTRRDNIKEARIFRYESYVERRWEEMSDKFNQGQISSNIKQRYGVAFCIFLQYAATISVLFCLYPRIGSGSVTLGLFIAVAQAMWNFTGGFQYELIRMFCGMKEGRLFTADFLRFLQMSSDCFYGTVSEADESSAAVPFRSMELKDIWYRYDKEGPYILRGVSLCVSRGDKVGLVGENGSGKSTLIKIMAGLLEPEKGEIYLNGIPITEENRYLLRRAMSVVWQDFCRFDLTLQENLALERLDGKDDAEKMAEILEGLQPGFLEKMEEGLHTFLGKSIRDGQDLSGGQWQMAAIARSVFSGRQGLVLDEPTAALDPLAEVSVYETVYGHLRESAAFLVTHRLGAVVKADCIYVLKEGIISEQGDHVALLGQNGAYRSMFATQRAWYEHGKEGEYVR